VQLASVRLQGFRNLTCSINLCGPLSLIVGENNSGKSNLIDAIRLVLRALAYPSHQLWVTLEEFPHDGRGVQVADAFEIKAPVVDRQGPYSRRPRRGRRPGRRCAAGPRSR
jgi:predicted ATP-dependent endonuclease of OLD family